MAKLELDVLEAAIQSFNRYHSPEARAELYQTRNGVVIIKFIGHYCKSCGVYDWFDDLRIEMERNGLIAEIKNIKEIENGHVVTFYIRKE